ncbi:adenylate/guanylate cyclase domain-containing protein [Mesorhizobium sp. ZC-5]|uniref:adenylate/guanylate cyclase domain-containing protein n=1 Tax=Mesorhizobium sp. ZC-5 TaxID=2986066 RepID=UPI0021E6DEB7|nr:adenylate/guanylate cyclase domain-containing protein [Mesorhizobium sp. ZC-5]MCV3239724.1 adenylate/guanylate cyclase domain-containing protein [Mesorhizobium sp. ZC-5]
MIDEAAIDALFAWMLEGARPCASANDLADGVCRQLVAAGVPVDRFALFTTVLDPNLVGWRFGWTPEEGAIARLGELGLFATDEYTANPVPVVSESQKPLRRRLGPDTVDEYKLFGDLVAEGFTDYLMQPVIYTTGEADAVSWATKAPDGFSDRAVAALQRINAPLARLAEIHVLRLNAANLLSAYVGRDSGDQILKGKIHRGDGEEIEAAILFVDVVDFTRVSGAMSGPEAVAMLNAVFDLVVPPVEANGGEILKFLGDGFLAIFPYADEDGLAKAVLGAVEAVRSGEAMLAASTVAADAKIRSALHAGRFHFGNVGGSGRLDFTAIGQPVNFAARLLQAASTLGCSRVASGLAAGHLGSGTRLTAEVEFKGFEGVQQVFAY